ncbi:MAG TPA: hypothetical protein VFR35_18020 [Actinoplanes sp.]|nr:hypothetical protein [Actinoplanes sp.]
MTAPQPPVGPPYVPSGRTAGQASVPNPQFAPLNQQFDPPDQHFAPPVSPAAPTAPDEEPAPAPAAKGRLATLVAFVAVLVALLAAGIAGWAVHRANVAVAASDRLADQISGAAQPTATPAQHTPTEPGAEAPTQEPTPDPGLTTEPTLDPQAVYEKKYDKRVLTAQIPYSGSRYIDLDAPRVDDQDGADVTLHTGNTSSSFNLEFPDGAAAASVDDPQTTPNDCAEKIQYSPLAPGDRYSFRQGDVFCVKTSLTAAQARADNQRIVVLEIKSVGSDDTISLSVTAWDVPR